MSIKIIYFEINFWSQQSWCLLEPYSRLNGLLHSLQISFFFLEEKKNMNIL